MTKTPEESHTPKNTNDLKMELAEIKGEICEIRRNTNLINSRDAKLSTFIASFVGLFGLVTIAFNVYNTQQFDKAITRAENRIDMLAGTLKPQSATVHGIRNEDSRKIVFQASIEPIDSMYVPFFRVKLFGLVDVKIRGANGRVVGYNSNTIGELGNFIARRIDGTISEYEIEVNKNGSISTEGTFFGGKAISENAPLRVGITRFSDYETCEEAQAAIERLVGFGDNLGEVGLIPLFADIEEPASNFSMFQARAVIGNYMSCETLKKYDEVVYVEEPITKQNTNGPH